MKIFLIENEDTLRDQLHEKLDRVFDVHSFENCERATKALVNKMPDLIYCDYDLGRGMNGLDFADLVKKHDACRYTRFVMMTRKESKALNSFSAAAFENAHVRRVLLIQPLM